GPGGSRACRGGTRRAGRRGRPRRPARGCARRAGRCGWSAPRPEHYGRAAPRPVRARRARCDPQRYRADSGRTEQEGGLVRFDTERIRNVALVGHAGAGKTTLAEALLHRAGVVNRPGRVEDGTTVTDHDPEEQRRGISLPLAVAPFEWRDHKVNLIDTPGYADFLGDVLAALRVVDLAVFVVSAVDGVEVQTEVVWR